MRRLALALALLAAAALAGVLAGAGEEDRAYRVDAIFDNTASLIPGQDVKIAGARVGSVTEITLTPDNRARVQMWIDEGFAPFRTDADCIIRPQSLIGEKFVQCDPGTPRARPLRGRGGKAPTVPLEQTHSPVDLDLIFGALRLPYRERLSIIVNELGTGLAGRPSDLSEAIRRANPALQEANEVLRILDADRATLGRLVERSDELVAELAGRRAQVSSFVDRASSVGRELADRRAPLGETIRRLPPLLDELEPSAARLATLARGATPLARDLRSAAPSSRLLLADLDPRSRAARPALRSLAELARTGRPAIRVTRPVARVLVPIARRLAPVARVVAALNESLRATGTVEGLQTFVYLGSATTARFDRFSHIFPSYQVTGRCAEYATEPVAGCSARFSGGGGGTAARSSGRQPGGRGASAERAGRRGPGAGAPDDPAAEPALDFLLGP